MPSVGSIYVEVLPSTSKFSDTLRSQISPQADALGMQIGKQLADRLAAGIKDGLSRGFDGATQDSGRKGAAAGGAFADTFKAKVEAALKALPDAKINADSSEADRKIAELRARLAELADKRVGVDIDAAAASAELTSIKARLDELGAKSPNVQVKTDTARASAELAAFQLEVDKINGENPTVKPNVDTSQGVQSFNALLAAGVALGPALIPVAATVTAAFASITAAAAAAGSAIGVGILAGAPVVKAFQALGAQQDASGATGVQSAAQAKARADAIASANSQVASSEAALANTRASAASAAINAAQRVSDAQRQAAQSVQQAELGVTSAEQALTTAQTAAKNAQQALTDARKAAEQQLQDYQTQLADGVLAQRAATLAIAQAKQTLDQTNASAGSTTLQREQAQLAYDQAVQQQKDLAIQQSRLKDNAAAAAKAGVDGSQQVQAAQANVVSTTQGVADAQSSLARAQAAVVEAQRKGAEQVATAQRAQADQARQSAASVASAQAAVGNAQRSLAKAYDQTGTAGASAADKIAQAFAGLSPAGAEFTRFLFGLKGQFTGLSEAAQNGLLPGVQSFISAILPALPQVTQFVGVLSKAMGDLFVNAGKALSGPFWSQFFSFLARETPKWLVEFAGIMGNLVTGFAALFQALTPVGDLLNGMIASGAQKFADWAKGLMSSDGFKGFLDYAKQSLPQVVQFFGAFFQAAGAIVVALAPLGPIILNVVTQVLKFIGSLNPTQLGLIAAGIGAAVVGFQVLGPIISALTPVLAAITAEGATFGTVLAALGGPVTLVIAGLAALTIGLIEAYQHSQTFRDIVNGAFTAVRNAIVVAWEQGIKPALMALWQFIQVQIMPTVLSLWHNVIVPAFTQIGQTISLVWNNIILPALNAWWWLLKNVVGPSIMWLLNNVVGPAFKGIGAAITFAWQNVISPTLTLFNDALKALPGVFDAIVSGISTAWGKLTDVISGPITAVMSFIKTYFIDPLNTALHSINVGLKIPWPNTPQNLPGASPNNASSRVSHFASGGTVGGYSPHDRADNIFAKLTAGEFVLPVRATNAIRSLVGDGGLESLRQGMLPGFADGGIVNTVLGGLSRVGSTIESAVSSAASGVVSASQFAASFLNNPAGAIGNLLASIAPRLGSGPFPTIAVGALNRMTDAIAALVSPIFAQQQQTGPSGPLTQGIPSGASAQAAVTYALGQAAAHTSGWLDRCLAFVNAAWGHRVPSLGLPRAIDAWNAAPNKHVGGLNPPAGAALFYTTGNPAGHVDLSLGGNSIASTDLPIRDRVGVVGFNTPMSSWGARYLGWYLPGYANGGAVGDSHMRDLLGAIPTFDNGGILQEGLNLVNNQTGGPERLYREGRGGGDTHHHWNIQPTDPYAIAREQARIAWMFGG